MICEIKRQVLPRSWVSFYASAFANWFDRLDVEASLGRAGLESFKIQSGIPACPAFDQANNAPPGMRNFVRLLRPILPPGPWYALVDMLSVRRQAPEQIARALRWHQDAAVVSASFGLPKLEGRGFVVWVPFTRLDGTAPSLEVMPRWRWSLRHVGNPYNGYYEAEHEPKLPWFSRRQTIGRMELGDVLLFDLRVPHRTYIKGTMTQSRFSMDLRIVDCVPKSYSGNVVLITN